MTIRPMTSHDYPAVFSLWTSLDGVGMRSLDDSEEGIRKFLTRNPNTCFVAEEGSALAGVIMGGHDGRRGYIYHAAVDDAFRNRGIGSALAAAVEEAMGQEGIHKIALVCFASNDLGNRFWDARGYSERTDLVYRNKSINPENK
ncbi:GNAT family N-acetyltransferase [Breznakiella homolactica]|uniref:GNAT family N-acetyltransferase n=1 Tax=Breznakiella homolactica TaxID=2798577 RepID=A0A7T7XL32_9SPIR|nr:GNAT family N-acetyltransferase [Breznakiella homolactica]QQO08275.1 GNAT family N-acetyltransferase [Breznakiella homolactica]